MEGFLNKRGRGKSISFIRPWTRRYFVLNIEEEALYYYTSDEPEPVRSKNFRGKVSVSGGHVKDTGNAGKPNSFEFHVKDGNAEILVLAADSLEDKEVWMAALSKSSHNAISEGETNETLDEVKDETKEEKAEVTDPKCQVFMDKMRAEGLSDAAIRAFANSYADLTSGSTGMIPESTITPVPSLPHLDKDIKASLTADTSLLEQTVVLKLNGGLGTSMGLDKAKSLLEVKDGNTFLDLTAKQVIRMREKFGCNVKFMLMNSFNTSQDTLNFLQKYPDVGDDIELMQNKVPKVDKGTMLPAEWSANPHLEWCPPGHGDLYSALYGSGKLGELLSSGVKYMFVSNSDNLGATLDVDLLTYFAQNNTPFMMECCERTAADKKGGHLALRTADQQLILRESAQCAAEDEAKFQSVDTHKYFNTNNLWIRLDLLEELMESKGGFMPLPTIFNSKTVDPQRDTSPPVFQLETAMGAAIEMFPGSGAVCVPRSRFAPVKKCSDLFLLRSDAYVINEDHVLVLNPACQGKTPIVDLDSKKYKLVQQLEGLIASYPSLVHCTTLSVKGRVSMSVENVICGNVSVVNSSDDVEVLPPGKYDNITVNLSESVSVENVAVELSDLSLDDNHAFVFIKPHANTPATQALVTAMLAEKGVHVLSEGEMTAEEIDSGMHIDQHYYAIASKATLLKPAELPVPAQKFEDFFGLSWEDALASGNVYNAIDGCAYLGIDADALDKLWGVCKKEKKLIKFGGGFYCGLISVEGKTPAYIFNGFFMSMRSKYVTSGTSIHYYTVSFNSSALSWADFRGNVLGPTDPSTAPADSVRGKIMSDWESLGLKAQPDTGDNGVHASASPFEGLAERMNWLKVKATDDPFGAKLLSNGVSEETLKAWSVDPQVKGNSLFDSFEDLDCDQVLQKAVELNAPDTSADDNHAFVFVKPHANTPATQALVSAMLAEKGIHVLSEGEMTAEEIDSGMHIDQHYYAIASKATLLKPAELPVPAQKFEDFFGLSWEDALASGNVYNAIDGCAYLGIDADALDKLWGVCKKEKKLIKFGGGFYCGLISVEGKTPAYIFNGFFMSMRSKYVTPGTSIHYYTVSFNSSALSWADFRGNVLGPTDPSTAPADSVRGKIMSDWESLGLKAQPDTGDNGVHASASPFEGLAERMNWLKVKATDDPFGAKLLSNGVSEETLKAWSVDPQVKGNSLFDSFEDLDCDQVLQKAVELNAPDTSADDNHAFVFVKPHANTPATQALVSAMLAEKGIHVLSEGEMTAEEIDSGMHIDQHYYAIASKATLLKPAELPVPAQKFEDFFGLSWEDALASGNVYNAIDGCAYLGIDADALDKLWGVCKKEKKLIKFGGGFYCGLISVEGKTPAYIFNGFFMSMRSKYVTPGTSIHYYTVSFNSSALSWADFRGNVLGPTDPSTAPADSVRGKIMSDWESLGLKAQPDTGDNGVHASASPFEGLAERMNWLKVKATDDPFGAKLLSNGVSEETLKAWSVDPQVKGNSLFDSFEDLDCDQVLQKAVELNAPDTSADDNHAFVFVKPHANTPATQALVSAMLAEKGIHVLSEGEMTAEEIDSGMHIDQHYYAIASKATLLKPAELPVPAQKFEDFFGLSWEDALASGNVYNAIDGCAYLGIDADALDKLWGVCKKEKKLIKFGGGFYCGLISVEGKTPAYIFNGFFMSMRSKYVTPGTSIHYYTVSFNSSALSWADFRGNVLGPTDPSTAPADSVRGKIMSDWESLGLKAQPDTGDNGVHASASPFEGLAERMNWLKVKATDDPFGAKLLSNGVSEETLKAWSVDPQVKGNSLFDSFEDLDCDQVLQKAVELNA